MSTSRVAMLSVHTSPLAQPGAGDGGGMNVYVRSVAEALARAGVECDVLTRAEHPEQPPIVELEPGLRVVHLDAGPRAPVPKRALPALLDELVAAAREHLRCGRTCYDAIHANYWVSGAVAHRLKHELDVPMVATFHTLARVKAEAGIVDDPEPRGLVEAEIVRCADLVVVSTADEQAALCTAHDADPERIEVIAPGVDHALFSPGRSHLGSAAAPPPRRPSAPRLRRPDPGPQGRRRRARVPGRPHRPTGRARHRRRPERRRRS